MQKEKKENTFKYIDVGHRMAINAGASFLNN